MSRIPLPFAVVDVSALARSLRSQMEALGRTPSHLELLNMLARAGGRRNFQHLRAAPLDAQPGLDDDALAAPGDDRPGDFAPRAGVATPERMEDTGLNGAASSPPWPDAAAPSGGLGVAQQRGAAAGIDAARAAPLWAEAAPTSGVAPRAAVPDPDDPAQARRLKRLAGYFDARCRLIRWPGKYSHREPCLWALWSRLPAGHDLDEPGVNALLQEAHLFGDHALLRRELFDHGMLARTPDGRVYRRVERAPTPMGLELIRRLGDRRAAP